MPYGQNSTWFKECDVLDLGSLGIGIVGFFYFLFYCVLEQE